jgi:hypothetical protein
MNELTTEWVQKKEKGDSSHAKSELRDFRPEF